MKEILPTTNVTIDDDYDETVHPEATHSHAWAPDLQPNSTCLYAVLGLPRTAASHDIELVYSAVQYRRRQHDFNFARVRYAYKVLRDPLMRGLYDRLGEGALQYFQNRYAIRLADGLGLQVTIMIAAFNFAFAWLAIIVCLALLASKIDGSSDPSWEAVMCPMWVLIGVVLLEAFIFVGSRALDQDPPVEVGSIPSVPQTPLASADARSFDDSWSVCEVVGIFAWMIFYLTASTLIPSAAREEAPVWLPVLFVGLGDIGFALFMLPSMFNRALEIQLENEGLTTEREKFWRVLLVRRIFVIISRPLAFILVALRLTRTIMFSWLIPLIPIFVFQVSWTIATWFVVNLRKTAMPHLPMSPWRAAASNAFVFVLMAIAAILVALKLDGTLTIPLAACLSPVFLLFTLLLFFALRIAFKAGATTVVADQNHPRDVLS